MYQWLTYSDGDGCGDDDVSYPLRSRRSWGNGYVWVEGNEWVGRIVSDFHHNGSYIRWTLEWWEHCMHASDSSDSEIMGFLVYNFMMSSKNYLWGFWRCRVHSLVSGFWPSNANIYTGCYYGPPFLENTTGSIQTWGFLCCPYWLQPSNYNQRTKLSAIWISLIESLSSCH